MRNCNYWKYPDISGDPENIEASILLPWVLGRVYVGYKSWEKFHIYVVICLKRCQSNRAHLAEGGWWEASAGIMVLLLHGYAQCAGHGFSSLTHTEGHRNMEKTVVGTRRLLCVVNILKKKKRLTNIQSIVSSIGHHMYPKDRQDLICHKWGECGWGWYLNVSELEQLSWSPTEKGGVCASSLLPRVTMKTHFHHIVREKREERLTLLGNLISIYQKGKYFISKGYLNQTSLIYHWVARLNRLNTYFITPYTAPIWGVGEWKQTYQV